MPTPPAVVLVTHETCDEVLGCLGSLAGTDVVETVVVDTGSTDGTAVAVRRRFPEVRVIELANAGFGRAANTGMRLVDGDVVIVANADVRFTRGSVGHLAQVLEDDPSVALVGPAVRYPDGRHQASARRLPDLGTAVGHATSNRLWPANPWTRRYRALDVDPDRPRDTDWLSGCALAVRRDAFEAIGGFDPGYHLYVEDLDLGIRLRAAGWRSRYHPAVVVHHRVGASTSRRRARALVTHARSLARFHRRHYRGPVHTLLRPLLWAGLVGWVAVTWAAERIVGARRSSTGEPTDRRVVRGEATRGAGT